MRTVLEKFMLNTPLWQEGYRRHIVSLAAGPVWIGQLRDEAYTISRLDRKGNISQKKSKSFSKWLEHEAFLQDYSKQLLRTDKKSGNTPQSFIWPDQTLGVAIEMRHFGRLKALLFVSVDEWNNEVQRQAAILESFIASQVELAYKNFELNNFYETVHPRALALSTIHSVHRVISSSLRLQDLLPRIGRLSAQVLKARGCSIMLVDADHEYLIPYFSMGTHARLVHAQRVRIGRGIQGKIAATGEYYLARQAISVPFIEDDIVGVIALWDRIDGKPFTKIDLEILKSLSEQAVVAIKNARLFEETEKLTLGSIKTINELLELSFGGDRSQLEIFGKIVMEIGKDVGLSSRDLLYLDRALLLLDTGALAVSWELRQKKGKLTKKEIAQIRRIPSKGADILRSISSLQPIIPIILHQHERFDGKGYPQGLAGEEIPIGARIVSVVNSFIAMISKRSYRERMSVPQALEEIRKNQNTQFDPRVVGSFLKIIKRPEILEKINAIKSKAKALSAAKSD